MTAPLDVLAVMEDAAEYVPARSRPVLTKQYAEARAAVAELAKAGRLLQRAFAFDPGIKERRELWAEMGQPTDTLPTIAYIRRAATRRFATALAKFQEGA